MGGRSAADGDQRGGRENHSAWTRGVGCFAGEPTCGPSPPARCRATIGRKKTPVILSVLEELVAPETAGDPMTAQKWVRSSLRTLSVKLEAAGHVISPPTVGRLLRKLDYSLHVNSKKIEASSAHPDRDQQFDYIAVQRARFTAAGLPIISTDTKKKQLVGDFKNAGQTWSLEPIAVNVHDFPGDADGRAVPYGVYDITTNRGFIYLGTSGDTPAFAVDAIAAWWQSDGHATWPGDHLLVLADAGGSNGCRIRAWKERLQVQICDRFGLTVTVCHYPTGCSKPNPGCCPDVDSFTNEVTITDRAHPFFGQRLPAVF